MKALLLATHTLVVACVLATGLIVWWLVRLPKVEVPVTPTLAVAEEKRPDAPITTPEQLIAALDGDIQLAPRADRVLSRLASKYKESRKEIGDITFRGWQMMREKGIHEPMITMMENINYATEARDPPPNYQLMAALYLTMLQKGKSSAQATEAVRDANQRAAAMYRPR